METAVPSEVLAASLAILAILAILVTMVMVALVALVVMEELVELVELAVAHHRFSSIWVNFQLILPEHLLV
jgi:hypothetical protein